MLPLKRNGSLLCAMMCIVAMCLRLSTLPKHDMDGKRDKTEAQWCECLAFCMCRCHFDSTSHDCST